MKTKIKLMLLLTISILCCLGFAACEKPPQILEAPQNLRMEENKLVWDEVEHANGYAVYSFGEEKEITETYFDFSELDCYGTPFEVEVIALGDNTYYLDSDRVFYSCTLFDYSYGLKYIPTEDGTGYQVARGNVPPEGEIYIPDYYNGLPVKEIRWHAFDTEYSNHSATGVRLPETLEVIGEGAFAGCRFTQVKIPDSVTTIKEKTFEKCPLLLTVQFSPDSDLTTIEDGAFSNCPYLIKIAFPPKLETIKSSAFENCVNLRMVEFPSSLKTIGPAFSGCKLLNNVTLPAGVTLQGSFRNCTSLTKIDCSECAEVGSGTFQGCTALTEIIFPEDMSKFSPTAIFDPFPDVTIGSSANAAWYDNQPDGFVIANGALLCYKGDVPSAITLGEFPEEVEYISDSAFAPKTFFNPNSPLESIEIPDGVKLGAGVFGGCNSLKHVRLPSDLKEIPKKTFYDCSSLESLEIPEGVTKIGEQAFAFTAITVFDFPASLEVIERSVFDKQGYTYTPVKIYFKGNVQSINPSAFSIKIQEIVAPISLFAIGNVYITDDALIYYLGTEAEWNEQSEKFPAFKKGTHYFYVENEADLPADGGNYWHYGQDGKTPVVWNTDNT